MEDLEQQLFEDSLLQLQRIDGLLEFADGGAVGVDHFLIVFDQCQERVLKAQELRQGLIGKTDVNKTEFAKFVEGLHAVYHVRLHRLHEVGGLAHGRFFFEDHIGLLLHPRFECFDFIILLCEPGIDVLQFGKQGELDLLVLSDLFFLVLDALLQPADIDGGLFDPFVDLLFLGLVRVFGGGARTVRVHENSQT